MLSANGAMPWVLLVFLREERRFLLEKRIAANVKEKSMQTKTSRRLWVWLPVALWMIVIFIFSAQPATASGSMSKGITLTVLSSFRSGARILSGLGAYFDP